MSHWSHIEWGPVNVDSCTPFQPLIPLSFCLALIASNYPTADTYMCMHIQKGMIRKHRTPRQLCFVSRPSKRSQPCKGLQSFQSLSSCGSVLKSFSCFPLVWEPLRRWRDWPWVLSNWIWPGCAQVWFYRISITMFEEDILCFRYWLWLFPDRYGQELCFSSTWTLRANKLCFYSLFLNRSLSFLCFIHFASSIFLSILCSIKKCLTAVKKPCQTQNKSDKIYL